MNCPNLFASLGYSDADIGRRFNEIRESIFDPASPDSFYRENDDGTAYVFDTGNNDVRTEGMSYAMMMAVQMDDQKTFDRLWLWVMRNMYMEEGPHAGYFAWSCALDGKKNSMGSAPDGEEYFACALLFAEARWGGRTEGTAGGAAVPGIFEYRVQASRLLSLCAHRGETGRTGFESFGYPMWDRERRLIKFIPDCDFSDPSYHLPHFYRIFAERSGPEDAAFWREAAAASSAYIAQAAHPVTGLSPEYAYWDGTPNDERGFGDFYSDAYRVAANIGLNAAWGDNDKRLAAIADRMLAFFGAQNPADLRKYKIDGTATDTPSLHPVGLIATNAQAALALIGSDSSRGDSAGLPEYAEKAVRLFWNTPPRTGERRYYDNCLYFFAFLALSGRYLAY